MHRHVRINYFVLCLTSVFGLVASAAEPPPSARPSSAKGDRGQPSAKSPGVQPAPRAARLVARDLPPQIAVDGPPENPLIDYVEATADLAAFVYAFRVGRAGDEQADTTLLQAYGRLRGIRVEEQILQGQERLRLLQRELATSDAEVKQVIDERSATKTDLEKVRSDLEASAGRLEDLRAQQARAESELDRIRDRTAEAKGALEAESRQALAAKEKWDAMSRAQKAQAIIRYVSGETEQLVP